MKKLTLDQIKSGSLIGHLTPVSIEIDLNGEKFEFDTHIKPFSYATAVARMQAYGENKEALAGIIATSLYDEKGEQAFTTEEVRENFTQSMTEAIWSKLVDINSLGKEKSNSNQTQNSSVKSQLPQEEVSKKSDTSTIQK